MYLLFRYLQLNNDVRETDLIDICTCIWQNYEGLVK